MVLPIASALDIPAKPCGLARVAPVQSCQRPFAFLAAPEKFNRNGNEFVNGNEASAQLQKSE